ncbi:hypothetical protein WKR88_03995 [Trinickia caryophylli]|uniref:Uncharacterized protein n=1 Tax=Trinickia caryophylli TaxID=28094 RepID=A0A1X7CCV0_TRICW|nr:hypothetical protein [Trinickia caryophylli]TRX19714.1 hypothetical protein FNF07_16850 [Trinickia caryophylli]WQE12970.1 hypothetical protein U0034_06115 [Trinickia caryophylli]SME94196.1 hypothetical protein SAMN06295900_101182 [Trinickia caryophylli]
MSEYSRATLAIVAALGIYAPVGFLNCKNFPVTIHVLPDRLIGPVLAIYAFLIAGVWIVAVVLFFEACKVAPHAVVIERWKARYFIFGLAVYLMVVHYGSIRYCR